MQFQPGQHIHFVGIGGSGLSAIARILTERGFRVSGSDRNLNDLTDALARDGATIFHGHDEAYIAGADLLIITSAVKYDHVEVAAARAAGVPVYKRQDIMAALMEGQKVIAVAGTKGKTTTTAMIVHILRECGADPSYIVGGVMGNTGTNAGVGKGEYFVVEADEYDNMFLGLRPDIAVITNIEWDHPDFFKTPDEMIESFRQFINLLPYPPGKLVMCIDDPNTQILLKELHQNLRGAITYGLSEDADHRVVNLRMDDQGTTWFDLRPPPIEDQDQEDDGDFPVHIKLPGAHNALNAAAALLAAPGDGRLWDRYSIPLATFKPTARRFDLRADVNGIAIVDDYAHNPMSIRAVLEAARGRYPDRAVWAVWQPHTYSRTQALFDQFVTAFDAADHVLITDIYAARENPIPGVSSAGIVEAIQKENIRHTPTFADAVKALREGVQAPAVIIIMSAGDAPQIGIDYLQHIQGEA